MADLNHTPFKLKIEKHGQTPAPPPSIQKAPEAEPVSGANLEIKVEPVKEHKLAPEVQDYIKTHEEKVKIPEALKQIGVAADDNDQDFEEVVEGPTLPLTDQQIADGLKQPRSMSIRWLSLFLLYLLQQSHYTIKVVKGHVKRVVKP